MPRARVASIAACGADASIAACGADASIAACGADHGVIAQVQGSSPYADAAVGAARWPNDED